jgi:RNA polymerase sigma-70 factor, ECF subfamily
MLVPDEIADSAETVRLLEMVRSGNRDAFNDLFDRHRDKLRQTVQLRLDRRLRARVDPSDIVQEAHLEAYRRLDDYLTRRPMPFELWLRKTAQERVYNHYRTHLRTAQRSVNREVPLPEESSMLIAASFLKRSSSPSHHVARREYKRLVQEAVGELSEIDREIILMRNVEGYSQREISLVLELSHDAVRNRYGRALVKLQRLLVSKGLADSQS